MKFTLAITYNCDDFRVTRFVISPFLQTSEKYESEQQVECINEF